MESAKLLTNMELLYRSRGRSRSRSRSMNRNRSRSSSRSRSRSRSRSGSEFLILKDFAFSTALGN